MVTGSVASSFHGKPRSTFDLDIVIDPTEQQLDFFLNELGDQYYVSPAAAKQAHEQRGMFNLIDYATGIKIDFILRKDRAFSREEFGRRKLSSVMGVDSYVVTAEDSILSKLEWSKLSPSGRQLNDAVETCRVNSGLLEINYLKTWALELGVAKLLQSVLEASGLE
jgi:hypothetical protein